jgi:hypothetical protein
MRALRKETVAMLRPISLLLLLVFTASGAARADDGGTADYQPGQGWLVPGTGLRLGGYASATFQDDRHEPATAGANDLSLFTWWEGDSKFKFFSELDLEDGLTWDQGRGLTTNRAYLALERLYVDYAYSDSVNLRGGKFLTPVGRWNTIHAAPLVWTTSRPLITERSFPTNATGAMVYGTVPALGKALDYSVYAALGGDWRPNPKLDPFAEAYGFHVSAPLPGVGEFGVSYVNFEQRSASGERRNLIGMDYFRTFDRYELSAEAIYRLSDEGNAASEKGFFVQGVAPLSQRLYLVGRYEWFDPAGPIPPMSLNVLGLAFKVSPAVVLKAEVSHASSNHIGAQEGVFASFAILF